MTATAGADLNANQQCTNMAGARVAAEIEKPDGPLLLDSVAVTLWGCLTAVGIRADIITGYGRIFSDPRLNP